MNIQQMFDWSVVRNPETVALDWFVEEETYTYTQLRDETERIAGGLEEQLGVSPGGTVAYFAPNCPELILAMITNWRFGQTVVPLNFRVAGEELKYFLEHTEADCLVYHSSVRKKVDSFRDNLPVDRFAEIGDSAPDWAVEFDQVRSGPRRTSLPEVHNDTLATLVFTGGTTGLPKCIPVDHIRRFFRSLVFIYRNGIREGDNVGFLLPLYHSLGLTVLLATIQAGGTITLFPKPEPERILKTIEEKQINAIQGVPSIYKGLVDSDAIDQYDTSSLHEATTAGQVLTESLFKSVTENLCERFINLYGSTESMHICYTREPSATVGKAAAFQKVRIVEPGSNDPEAELDVGQVGEVILRMDGPEVFDGYWKNSEATEEVVHDGWFFTGDLAERDDEGIYRVVGRTDDMIISGGENISPSEVEDVLISHPAVSDAGVVGAPSEQWGEKVLAFVVAEGITAEELDEYCKSRDDFTDFKRPREYRLVDEIPTTPVGKTDRVALSEMV